MIFLCLLLCGHPDPSLARVRGLYEHSMISEDSCKVLLTLLNDYDVRNAPLLAGYRAGAMMVMAKYTTGLWAKWKCFREGRDLLERSVAIAPNNIELIFIRYSIQMNCPWFLHYRQSVEEDRKFIGNNVESINDPVLRNKITNYMERSGE